MAEKLRPCPLCGSTDVACFAEECGDDYDNEPVYRAVVGCRGCHEEGCDPTYDEEPCFGIEAYFRADHPLVRDCEDPWDIERVLERHMAERWNVRAGRTAAVEVSYGAHGPDPRFVGDVWTMHHACSACGGAVDGGDRYCKHCGARLERKVDA